MTTPLPTATPTKTPSTQAQTPPRIRASYAKELLHGIDALPARDRIRARLPDGVADRVLETPGLSLLDGADHQALLEASFAELDRDGYIALIRQQTAKYREAPLLAATIRTLQRLLGRSAHGLLKHLPRLRDVTVQGYGTLTYAHAGEHEARFVLEGYPPQYMTDANRALFEATFLGALDILDIQGEATTTREDRAKGAAEYTVRWRL
jgi:hypothetical protein